MMRTSADEVKSVLSQSFEQLKDTAGRIQQAAQFLRETVRFSLVQNVVNDAWANSGVNFDTMGYFADKSELVLTALGNVNRLASRFKLPDLKRGDYRSLDNDQLEGQTLQRDQRILLVQDVAKLDDTETAVDATNTIICNEGLVRTRIVGVFCLLDCDDLVADYCRGIGLDYDAAVSLATN